METRPSVSVVIPVYNRIEPLRRAVRSALDQTVAPDEIVIVDDASPDAVTAEALGIDDSRIRILRLPSNQGASAARMAGVTAARGEVVAFLDSDDTFSPGKLEAQLPLLGKPDELIAVACGWTGIDENTGAVSQRIPIESADPVDFASGCWFCPGSTVILRKRAFDVCGPFDPTLRRLEDLDWFLRFALAGGALRVAPIIGATIGLGRRANPEMVFRAADAIAVKFQALRASRRIMRHLRAWLHVERAVALRNRGKRLAMVTEMLRSLTLVPRAQVQLRRWWG
jgi:glycosyltransferase involved in cell wall biosynthesis